MTMVYENKDCKTKCLLFYIDWSIQLQILALVGRWTSPNIPHARCTHCTRGVLTPEVELRKF